MEKTKKTGNPFSDNGNKQLRDIVWDDTRAFLAVARHGTLSAAAVALDVGIATLSRHIERLEAALKLPLFVRQQSGYRLTEEGAELLERAEAMEAAALSFASQAEVQATLTGKVRLATAEGLASHLILPALAPLRERYPELSVEIVTATATANLHRHDADLAIRMVKPERGNVSLRRLGTLGYGLYGSPDYAARRAASPADLALDNFITWTPEYAHLPAAQWIERALAGRQAALATTTISTQVAATHAGLGLAVLPHFIAREAGLTCIDANIDVTQPIFLVIQSDLARARRVRVLADFLTDLVQRNHARLSG